MSRRSGRQIARDAADHNKMHHQAKTADVLSVFQQTVRVDCLILDEDGVYDRSC